MSSFTTRDFFSSIYMPKESLETSGNSSLKKDKGKYLFSHNLCVIIEDRGGVAALSQYRIHFVIPC